MMENEIQDQLKQALKRGEKLKLSVLRMLVSDIKNKKIADKVKELSDENVLIIIKKMVRRHKESIEKFAEGARDDLVKKETEELNILEKYLPEELSDEELERIVMEVISETGASSVKDMGNVMKLVLSRTKGSCDGKKASDVVRKKLM